MILNIFCIYNYLTGTPLVRKIGLCSLNGDYMGISYCEGIYNCKSVSTKVNSPMKIHLNSFVIWGFTRIDRSLKMYDKVILHFLPCTETKEPVN